jgi:SAM-dependent methyltransferase
MDSVQAFYDELAESYHLIFEDWQRSIDRQGAALAKVLLERWGLRHGPLLDAAAGIGTQTLGLLAQGFEVTASDLSARAVARARTEAAQRGFRLPVAAADFRALPFSGGVAAAVIACDNAIPHLLQLDDIRTALGELARCAHPGGAVILSMRDYAEPPRAGTIEHRPYGDRLWNGRRFHAEQEWHWHGATYELILRIRPAEGEAPEQLVVRTSYLAVPVNTVLSLMRDVGLDHVERLDDAYYQPLLVGTVPNA